MIYLQPHRPTCSNISDVPNLAMAVMSRELDALPLVEDEQEMVLFDPLAESVRTDDYSYCIVGSLVSTRPYNYNVMWNRMANI
ncbi:hypothetical protein LINGRAHAP2_LOCUS20119 [Linum grandiflorum]